MSVGVMMAEQAVHPTDAAIFSVYLPRRA